MKFWERSEKHGSQWEKIFEGIDPDVRAFAGRYSLKITPWPWDAPEEILSWSSKGVHKNLRLYIEEEPSPYTLKLSGSAWVDTSIGDQRDRLAYYEQFEPKQGITIIDTAKVIDLGTKVRERLEEAFKAVDAWDFAFLRDSHRKGAKEAKLARLEPWTGKT